jgi:DNA-binding NarL/FixJ family response regulator
MNLIRVLLADDHTLVRAGVRALLEGLDDVVVVAEAVDGSEALRLVEMYRPDIAVLDFTMAKLTGLDVAARIADGFLSTRVIILTLHVGDEYVRDANMAGVSAYLLKDAGTSELEAAIRAVARGEAYLSPAASTRPVDGYEGLERGEAFVAHPLTAWQREVLRLIAQGLTSKAIARKLNVSIKTVGAHRTKLMLRLDIHDIAGLVRHALRVGLIEMHQRGLDEGPWPRMSEQKRSRRG